MVDDLIVVKVEICIAVVYETESCFYETESCL